MIPRAISTKAVSVFCFSHVSAQPWLSSNIMKWNDRLLEHHRAHGSDAEVLCKTPHIFRWERDGSRLRGWGGKHGLLKGPNVVSKSMRRKIYRRPLCWGAVIRQCTATKHASRWHRLGLGETSRLSGLQPVDMLVTSSSVSGSSYRSVVTFSGQGRLNDILTWDKAKGGMNSKYKNDSMLKFVTANQHKLIYGY